MPASATPPSSREEPGMARTLVIVAIVVGFAVTVASFLVRRVRDVNFGRDDQTVFTRHPFEFGLSAAVTVIVLGSLLILVDAADRDRRE
jgi:hypothetical protein